MQINRLIRCDRAFNIAEYSFFTRLQSVCKKCSKSKIPTKRYILSITTYTKYLICAININAYLSSVIVYKQNLWFLGLLKIKYGFILVKHTAVAD